MTRIVAFSDTHQHHSKLHLPPGDILICSGDFSNRGTLEETVRFAAWLSEYKKDYQAILVSPGNHDLFVEKNPEMTKEIFKDLGIHLLIHEPITIDEINFFMSPYTPMFCNWAFMKYRGEEMARLWKQIPDDTHFLVTHGPPWGILDSVERFEGTEFVGCRDLLNRINYLPNLKAHIFGHIHGNNNRIEKNGIIYVNAAICNEEYEPVQLIRSFDLDLSTNK